MWDSSHIVRCSSLADPGNGRRAQRPEPSGRGVRILPPSAPAVTTPRGNALGCWVAGDTSVGRAGPGTCSPPRPASAGQWVPDKGMTWRAASAPSLVARPSRPAVDAPRTHAPTPQSAATTRSTNARAASGSSASEQVSTSSAGTATNPSPTLTTATSATSGMSATPLNGEQSAVLNTLEVATDQQRARRAEHSRNSYMSCRDLDGWGEAPRAGVAPDRWEGSPRCEGFRVPRPTHI